MKINITGDKIIFKKRLMWKIVSFKKYPSGAIYYKYQVYRKYPKVGWLRFSDIAYDISYHSWFFTKKCLRRNKEYYYNMINNYKI